jgi:hypothetical protein
MLCGVVKYSVVCVVWCGVVKVQHSAWDCIMCSAVWFKV